MAYDEDLADRIRAALGARKGVSERKMFGGIAFMIGGNMAAGVNGDEMIVRVSPDEHPKLLKEKGAREFDLSGGRPMAGWLLVNGSAVRTPTGLAKWLRRGAEYAASLPEKKPKKRSS